MTLRCFALSILAVLASCQDNAPIDSGRLASLQTKASTFDADLNAAEADLKKLSADFDEVAAQFGDVAARYRTAAEAYRQARELRSSESRLSLQAAEDFDAAAANFRFARMVIKIAIEIDRARSTTDRAGRETSNRYDCATVSRASYRRRLEAQGVELTGKDIDHIVPHALGGADHPMNYQVLDSSLNRSLGKTWDLAKCALAGEKCAGAIAISSHCGTYTGGL